MKMVVFSVMFLVAEAACMFLIVSDFAIDINSSITGDIEKATASVRELTEGSNTRRNIKKENINLEDYTSNDPVPSSSAAIKSGPVDHGTPSMPYIPKPTTPDSPQHFGSPSPPSPA